MARTRKLRVGDQEFDAREEEFKIIREEWNEYELLDGGRVRFRAAVGKIYRILDADGQPAVNQEGDPQLIVVSANQVLTSD